MTDFEALYRNEVYRHEAYRNDVSRREIRVFIFSVISLLAQLAVLGRLLGEAASRAAAGLC